jgi:glycosyltransferase involved in cell wall biosynthesis
MLAPIAPAVTGNGLAMRTELFCQAAARDFDVRVVVVPVAGQLAAGVPRSRASADVLLDPQAARSGITSLMADSVWRERFAQVGTLPRLARAASPGLAGAVLASIDRSGPVAVHVGRSYLAPLGAAVAERIGAQWITLDLDEDDGALALTRGDREEAAAHDRLLAIFGPVFDGLAIASETEAAAIAERQGLNPELVPNAVQLPGGHAPRPGGRSGPSLLFVGNLTYPPNVEAARLLADAILPETRRRLGDTVRVELVGPYAPGLESLAAPGVEAAGFVADLGPRYAGADLVVVPLRVGGGTRIKILEAFAHGVAVVASPVAVAGLEVVDGRHLLLAEDPAGFARAIERLTRSPDLAERLVGEAKRLVRDQYSLDVVVPSINAFFARARDRAGSNTMRP